ncbi:hypothetical protein BIY21_12650 [Vibrio ponticus]|uniref:Peptidase M60 domain-containing protein n=1 Tax=Vibrio ponticus TaxID=265668 RepID=A0ABX3FJ44_9VIBR|nr:hypothetical protein [Vibrio ponticus]OLQ91859.1 hypothetical protein BIY21_12650 [Vibrio ponticus]
MKQRILVAFSLLSVIALFVIGKRSGEELSLPTCQIDQTVETPIHFFKGNSIGVERLEEFIDYSNQVLANSCVPMKRVLASVNLIDPKVFADIDEIGQLHRQLVELESEKIQPIQTIGSYYVLVLDDEHPFVQSGWSGEAHGNFSQSFALLASDAELHILEHELGHLAWAWHNDEPLHWLKGQLLPEHHKYIKPYARGSLCQDAGTVMTYAEKSLPIYSSPEIKYFGTACGDKETADNARHMREFAQSLM